MKKNIFVLSVVTLFICTSPLTAAPRNSAGINYTNLILSKENSAQKKVFVYHTPADLIKGHNFWIGCEYDDVACPPYFMRRPNHQENLSARVKKLFPIHNYVAEDILASIPDGIDFVLFNTEKIISAQDLLAWYDKIRPGGMLIGIRDDTIAQDTISKIFIDQNALIQRVTPHLWYIQKKHFLSCIIPTYNRAHTLSKAIDSLYKQNLTIPFEVIVTDDASTDETQELLHYYQQKYPNFSFYVHAVNGGASKARNTCIEHAHGDLIFNLDSDNYLEPKSLQGLIDLLDQTGADSAAFGKIKYFFPTPDGSKVLSHVWHFKFPNNICSFYTIFGNQHLPIGSGNYLFTKKSFKRAQGYNGRIAETWRFGYKQLATGAKIAILPGTYYWHRLSPDGKWKSNQALQKNNPAVFKHTWNILSCLCQIKVCLILMKRIFWLT